MPRLHTFTHSMEFAVPVTTAFRYFTDPDCIACMAPASLNVRLKSSELPLKEGSRILFMARPRLVPIEMTWLFQVTDYIPDQLFADVLLKGPVSHWVHRQKFTALSAQECRVEDLVEFNHPGGIIGKLVPPNVIESKLPEAFVKRETIARTVLKNP